ncbi:MAG TPA: PhnD/SsuA/transferrin family substrate-binding protein [Candidatus Saccharimonadales bacterium]|nr:PhnD/SsuA/transferrin family substrate-binding protein [Candidatus Saccharimonadales bacterium]
MADPLPLTMAVGDYDINRALIDGTVRPQGTDPRVFVYPSPERHWRMARDLEFDVCEFSLGTYLMLHDRGDFPAIAVPAFPHRRFRHGYIYVHADAGIAGPRDLEGRRVGIRTWQTTAGIWARGMLADDHGVDLSSIDWVAQDPEDIPLAAADRFRMRRAPDGDTVTAMLERGDLDALIYPETPAAIVRGDPRVARLFPDPKAMELDYVARTGLFPIMHTVIIRTALTDAQPWLARNVLAAFERSRALGFDAMRDPRRVSLAWFAEALEEQRRALGDDPWRYELAANRHALETLIRWSHEQGLIARPMASETLFAPTTHEAVPAYV